MTRRRARSVSRTNKKNSQQGVDSNNNNGTAASQTNQRSHSAPPISSSSVQQYPATLYTNPYERDTSVIVMYTDGSCYPGHESGIGVFFGTQHPLNICQALQPPHNSGRAEICAAQTGLNALRNWSSYKSENVTVRSDYLPMIEALQRPNQFSGAFGNEYRQLYSTARGFPRGVYFEHVYAHSGVPGNEAADELASRSTSRGRSRSRSRTRSRSRNRSRSKSNSSCSTTASRPRSVFIPPSKPITSNQSIVPSQERTGRSTTPRLNVNSATRINAQTDQNEVKTNEDTDSSSRPSDGTYSSSSKGSDGTYSSSSKGSDGTYSSSSKESEKENSSKSNEGSESSSSDGTDSSSSKESEKENSTKSTGNNSK